MKCKICQSQSNLFGTTEVLQKHPVHFYRCENCGLIQTENPYWLEEAYSNVITKSDIGLIGRNLEMARITKELILTCLKSKGRFIDYGGGYGMFVRLMRDAGFDFYRYDPLCENLFSVGFDATAGSTYDLLTAWEVFEHLVDPLAEFENMLSYSQNIVFSTQLLPVNPKPLGEWWYYGPEHGQHVTFYTKEALQIIARKFGLILIHSNSFMHWFGKTAFSPVLIKITFSPKYAWLRRIISKPPPSSLLQTDFEMLTGLVLK